MKSAPSLRPLSRATSPAIPVRRIGRVYGPDRAILGYFEKKLSNFSEINPQSHLLSQIFLRKALQLFQNQPAIQDFSWASLSSAP
jgi:hypothetical protein